MENDQRGGYQPPVEEPDHHQDREITPVNPPNAATQPGAERSAAISPQNPVTFTPEDLARVEEQLYELETQVPNGWERPEYYYLNTRRRIMEEAVWHGKQITPDLIAVNLARALRDARLHNHEEAYNAVDALRWGFLASAAESEPTLFQSESMAYWAGRDYTQMQHAAMEQQGQRIAGVALNSEQAQTLVWMLDQASIPHTLPDTETDIPFAPMEERLRETAAYADLERDFDTSDQMEQ